MLQGKVWGKYHRKFYIWLGAAVEWSKDFSRGGVIFTRLGKFFFNVWNFFFRNKKVELDSNLLGVNKKRKKKKSFSSDTESAALQKDSSRSRWGSVEEPKVACSFFKVATSLVGLLLIGLQVTSLTHEWVELCNKSLTCIIIVYTTMKE